MHPDVIYVLESIHVILTMSTIFRLCSLSTLFGVILALSVACSGLPTHTSAPLSDNLDEPGRVGECARFFSHLDERIDAQGVRDVEQTSIDGMPYLRTNRFLSSLRERLDNEKKFESWVDRMLSLDRRARRLELANLPSSAVSLSGFPESETDDLEVMIKACGEALRRNDLADAAVRLELSKRAQVPAHYQTYKRVLGLYPLTSLFVLMGVANLHDEVARSFATSKPDMAVAGRIVQYVPPLAGGIMQRQEVANILRRSANNPLGIPEPVGHDLERLYASFAPVWEIDVASDADRIGTPFWGKDRTVDIDLAQPRVYRRISHTWLGGRVLLQLNYQVWFPERPLKGRFDILGGHLDGMIWRVTLAENGEPILYDTIHNCGCYHMFFPSSRLRYTGKAYIVEEPLLIPVRAPRLSRGERVVLRVAHSTHYLVNVAAETALSGGVEYEFANYDTLRTLPVSDGYRRSLFGPDGLVSGTQRGERWILWPMGIPEPGAMRQWGHHATAFVGRRHFDDPDLLERYFERVH